MLTPFCSLLVRYDADESLCSMCFVTQIQVNFDDMMSLLMDYFEDEHKLDPEDPFLYEPLVPPPVEAPPSIIAACAGVKPQSPEQLQALVTLTDFARPKKVSVTTPKRVRLVHPSQSLV